LKVDMHLQMTCNVVLTADSLSSTDPIY